MAIKVLETKKTYRVRCSCQSLLEFWQSDVRFIKDNDYRHNYVQGYIVCPNCGNDVAVGRGYNLDDCVRK